MAYQENIPTLLYSPSIAIYLGHKVAFDKYDYYDVSEDVASCNVSRNTDSCSTFSFSLLDHLGKYDGIFEPMDLCTIYAQKEGRVTRLITGYITDVPKYNARGTELSFNGFCSLYRLQNIWWDPHLTASQREVLLKGGGDVSGQQSNFEQLLYNLLTKVGGLSADDIRIGAMPQEVVDWAWRMFEAQQGDVNQLVGQMDEFYDILMTTGVTGGGSVGGGGAASGASDLGQKLADVAMAEYESGKADGKYHEGDPKYWNFVNSGGFSDGSSTPWCACFVSWCAHEAGISTDILPKSAWAGDFNDDTIKGKGGNVHVMSEGGYDPQPGDIAVAKAAGGHVEIVVGADPSKKTVDTVGGNTSAGGSWSGNKCGLHEGRSYTYWYSITHPNYPVSVSSPGATGKGDFKKYTALSDKDIEDIATLCSRENGGKQGCAFEASLVANLYEKNHSDNGEGMRGWLRNSGWFNSDNRAAMDGSCQASAEEVAAVRTVLVDGKRTVPGYVDEHDFTGDIDHISTGDKLNASDYIPHQTVVTNEMGSVWVFYAFPPGASTSREALASGATDPFGYHRERRAQFSDDCYSI